jgi:hypothetical protein
MGSHRFGKIKRIFHNNRKQREIVHKKIKNTMDMNE